MKLSGTLLTLLAVAVPARAHFVWILPPEKERQPARVVFSDSLKPDNPELLKKVAHTEIFLLGDDGQKSPVKLTRANDALEASLPPGKGARLLFGVCRYGVVQRGQAEPFLLCYYPKAVVAGEALPHLVAEARDELPLQIEIPRQGSAPRVLLKGKPLAGAEVTVVGAGLDKPAVFRTQADGTFQPFSDPRQGEVYGMRVGYTEDAPGELDGKKYQSVKHYATLTCRCGAPAAAFAQDGGAAQPRPAEDPAATKLLADARAARANWVNFPGFSADLEVNFDGKVSKGTVTVEPKGKVTVNMTDPAAAAWAKRMLGSIVGHRLDDGSDLRTPCAFVDDVPDHPLGRAIHVLNDEFHSSYRIRDRQVIEVNRVMKDARFTITVLENRLNAEKQFLPVSYVVNYWDLKTGALQRAEAHHETWQRVGDIDLPLASLVLTSYPAGAREHGSVVQASADSGTNGAARSGRQETKSLKLLNTRLSSGAH